MGIIFIHTKWFYKCCISYQGFNAPRFSIYICHTEWYYLNNRAKWKSASFMTFQFYGAVHIWNIRMHWLMAVKRFYFSSSHVKCYGNWQRWIILAILWGSKMLEIKTHCDLLINSILLKNAQFFFMFALNSDFVDFFFFDWSIFFFGID